MREKKVNPKGSSWDELEEELFTPEEIAESKVRIANIIENINEREEKITSTTFW